MQKLADATACGTDARCVENTKAFAAMTMLGMGVSGGGSAVPVHVQQEHPAWRLLDIFGMGLRDGIREYGATTRSEHMRDLSIEQERGRTATGLASFGLAAAAVESGGRLGEAYAGALPGLAPTQTYTSGGPMSLGSMNIGDQAGHDNVRDGSQVGHSGPINTGTVNTGGVIGAGQIGNGRQNAPGPWTGNNDGAGCVGPGCQRVPLPELEDEEEGE
jgi:hypothetical protein